MLIVSAAKGGRDKVYYKDYKPLKVTMKRLAELAKEVSFSSYIYGEGVTSGGEYCQGHKAGESVIGAGNVLFFDFDDKGATFEYICERLRAAGVEAWVGPSKSWSNEVLKFHVAVKVDRELPLDKDEFKRWYKAAGAYLQFAGTYDPCMETWTQQMAPHWHEKGSAPEALFEGEGLPMDVVLASYVEYEGAYVGGSAEGFAGEIDISTVFVLSGDERELSYGETYELAKTEGKLRVHCIEGILHDGRKDTAFVRAVDDTVFYHCCGGRCGKTLLMPNPAPFEVVESDGEDEIVEWKHPVGLDDWFNKISDVIGSHPIHSNVYTGRSKPEDREAAVNYGIEEIMKMLGARYLAGKIRAFDGKVWKPLGEGDNWAYRLAQKAYRAAGFVSMATMHSKVASTERHIKKCVAEIDGLPVSGKDYLNMQNGMICITGEGVELVPHSADEYFTNVLEYEYAPGADCPVWKMIVNRIMMGSEELVKSLQDSLGYMFLPSINLEKMVAFVGDGENGKSTVLTVIKMLVGQHGYSSQPIQKLTNSGSVGEYARATLEGKWVNLTSEMAPKELQSEEFKAIVSGEDIQAREPYGKPFTIHRCPKQLAAMNATDRLVKEQTHGFHRRLHMIPFDYRIKQEDKDPDLWKKLKAEKAGILNWVLEGAVRVAKNNKLHVSGEMTVLHNNVIRDSNPVQQFIEERTRPYEREANDNHELADRVVRVATLYEKYKTFCQDNGYLPLGRNKFSLAVERLGIKKHNLPVKLNGVVHKACGFELIDLPADEWGDYATHKKGNLFHLVTGGKT